MNRYIIAAVISGVASEVHNELVNLVSTQIKLPKINTPSHITLKDSFYCEDTSEAESAILNTLSDKRWAKPTITLNGIENFRNEVYFIRASLNKSAFQIHKSLINHLRKISWLQWDKYDTINREFHLTITTKANKDNRQKIEELLNKYSPEFRVELDNISILKKIDDEKRWVIYKEFKL